MRRVLIPALLIGALLGAATAADAAVRRSVNIDLRNATDQTVRLEVEQDGSRPRRVTLDPGETARDLNDGISIHIELSNCGPTILNLSNAPIPGTDNTSLGAGTENAVTRDVDAGRTGELAYRGVRVSIARRADTDDAQQFDATILACRPAPSDTLAAVPEALANLRNVRGTVRNLTREPIDVVYRGTDGVWRALTVAPGVTSGEFARNETGLTLGFPDCGPAWLMLANPPFRYPYAAAEALSWTAARVVTGGLSEGENATLRFGGASWAITRQDDTSDSKRFAVDLVTC